MRLGKTLCAIRSLKKTLERVLVVCPKSVIDVWEEQLKEDGILDFWGFSSSKRKEVSDIESDWLVCNYEAVTKLPKEFLEGVDTVIADESALLKNPKAKITKFFLNNFKECKKVLLSGNPAPNSELEYVPQMIFLFGECMGARNYWEFRGRYCFSDFAGHQFWLKPGVKEKFKAWLHERCFFLTRKQAGVENKKIYEKRYVEMPAKLRKKYEEMETLFLTSTPSGKEIETKSALAQLNFLSQMAGGHLSKEKFSDFKIKELIYLLNGELKGERVVIWTSFIYEVENVFKELKIRGFKVRKIHGDVNIDDRKKYKKEFQDGKLDVIVVQIDTWKTGIDLSKADTAIYFSNGNSADNRIQSEHRIEHNTKKNTLLYLDLITKNTVDEDKYKSLKRRKKQSQYFLESVVENMRRRQ